MHLLFLASALFDPCEIQLHETALLQFKKSQILAISNDAT